MKFGFTMCVVSAFAAQAVAQQCTSGLVPMGYMGVSDENGSTSVAPSARVNAMALWDSDGDGPLPEMLVVGGAFRSIDGVPASSIAAWDGVSWRAIGEGFLNRANPGALDGNLDSEVTALTVHDGTLYAAGRLAFATPTGSVVPLRAARWTGSAWEQIGQDNSSAGTARIHAIQVAYGRLYVGGSFTYISNGSRYALGYYNTIAPNVPLLPVAGMSNSLQSIVRSMTMFGGELFVAGNIKPTFSVDYRAVRLAATDEFTPTQLECVGSCGGSAQQLFVAGDQLYVAGNLLLQNGTPRPVSRYLGNGLGWEPVGTAFVSLDSNTQVSVAVDSQGSVYRSLGFFAERWDGTNWVVLGAINGGTSVVNGSNVSARLLGAYEGKPIVGGRFATVQDGSTSVNTARFLESLAYVNSDGYFMPISQGVDNSVSDMALMGDDIIAVGRMGSAGGRRCGNIAVFGADNRWRPWSNNNGFERQTRSVAMYQGQPIVSGGFDASGLANSPFIRRWNGSQWVDMPATPVGVVETFVVAGDELWAEALTFRGSTDAPWVYRWDGLQWVASPAGRTIVRLQNCLGQIWGTRSGTISTSKVARWNGSAWEDVGPLTSAGKALLGEYQGSVLALGYSQAALGQIRTGMYRLVNDEWAYVGDFAQPRSLSASQGAGFNTRRVARSGNLFVPSGMSIDGSGFAYPTASVWDGLSWSTLGALAINIPAQQITFVSSSQGGIPIARGDDVFLAGAFVGRYERPGQTSFTLRRAASYFAKLGEGWRSEFSPHEDYVLDTGDTLVINSGATQFASGIWRLNGSLISNGMRASGAFVDGANTQTLTISNISRAEAGLYDFTTFLPGCVSSPTFSSFTAAASARRAVGVSITNECDSIDFNNDGSAPDPQDIEAFLSVFSEGTCVPANAQCNDIDFNNDGSVFDPRDIEAFLSVYSEGACL